MTLRLDALYAVFTQHFRAVDAEAGKVEGVVRALKVCYFVAIGEFPVVADDLVIGLAFLRSDMLHAT